MICLKTVGHRWLTCNPSYSGGRDQEDHSSKPAQANSSRDPISKNPSQKRAGGEFKPIPPKPHTHTHTHRLIYSAGICKIILQLNLFHKENDL
jgi:hypothetical protein